MPNVVYIAASLDGYIADRDGGLGWLEMVPNPEGDDLGFAEFMGGIDALVMGRSTFETVVGFGVPWPYPKPVFVASRTLETVPADLAGRVELVRGAPREIVAGLRGRGFERLYVDGGRTIQGFLADDLIDELIVTTLPILLGGGVPLFGALPEALAWERVDTEVRLGQLVQSRYRRTRDSVETRIGGGR